jgi:hypothetical protein
MPVTVRHDGVALLTSCHPALDLFTADHAGSTDRDVTVADRAA